MRQPIEPIQPAEFILGLLVLAVGACIYFLPTIIAIVRGVRSIGSLIVINLFLGWTVPGVGGRSVVVVRSGRRFFAIGNTRRPQKTEMGPRLQQADWLDDLKE
jgi:hypothetical protein